MNLAAQLQDGLGRLGLDLCEQQQKQLLDYLDMIAKWNKVYNLTAIRDPKEMLTHHLLDSLAVIAPLQKHLESTRKIHSRILDVGSGAGLPGVIIAICLPNVSVVCVDAVNKKTSFIQQAALTLGLKNLRGIHSRVEALPPEVVEDGFDVITSRAFAALVDFVQLTREHLVEAGGLWMAMKAKTVEAEAADLSALAQVFHVERLNVPGLNEDRCLVWMRPPPVRAI